MESILNILQATFLLVSIVGGSVAVVTYRRDANRRRAEWLMSFYGKFYEGRQYKRIRYLLDYRPPEYEELKRAVESHQADKRVEEMVDYLNFFEFVGSLWRLGQISIRDIRMLFEYYLDNIRSHDWLRQFVKERGFEALDRLLEEVAKGSKTSLLFVYGTLRKDSHNSMFHLLAREARFVGYARMKGRLFHLGEYPGLVPSHDADSWVHGEVYALDNPPDTLARLDGYEGCGPNDPEPHEFERVKNEVVLESGAREIVWVYVYRGSTIDKREILSGDYFKEAP